jgi:predicted acyltransferase
VSAATAAPERTTTAHDRDEALTPPPTPVTAPAQRPTRERLLSLDVFRGLTIAGMLLVNDPGTWSAIYPPLEHAAWHGWTPTDLIFPFFLFIVGITTHLSLEARRARGDDDRALLRQVIRRGLLIFLVGLAINGFPYFTWGAVDGIADPTVGQRVVDRLLHWRIMGVLQRIGIAYALAALLTFRTTLKQQVVIAIALLYGYWFAMTLLPVPGGFLGANVLHNPPATLAAWTDRLLLDWGRFGNHLWVNSRTWDPEGPLSTIPAIVTAMLGVIAGRWIATPRSLNERLSALFAAGALAMMLGLMWHWSFPINKSLWTSSYVLFTAGMASVALATCMWIIDEKHVSGWTRPFVIYGTNPLIAFAGSGVMARLIYSIFKVRSDGKEIPLEAWIYQTFYASWLAPKNASLLFAVTFVLFWLGVLWVLYRRRIFVKV